jgi:peptidoglycan/xylan/chitin deacetylase (PgdA/CDA1 family)
MNGISILMYHRVGRFGPVSNHRALFCDHRQFAAQMAYLNYMRYQVLSMDEALNLLRGNQPLPRRAVALTFDDGYQDFRDYALPTLARYGFPATVYAIAGDIGQRAHWLATDGMEAAPLLDAAGLREIQAAGITVGSHASSHSRLNSILASVNPTTHQEQTTRVV